MVKNGKKQRKTTFFEIKIDLQLRFDIKKCSYYLKKWRLLQPQFYLEFFYKHEIFLNVLPNGTYRVYSRVLKISSIVKTRLPKGIGIEGINRGGQGWKIQSHRGIGMESPIPLLSRFIPIPLFIPFLSLFPSLSRSIPIPLFIPFLSLSPFCIIININTLQKFYCIFPHVIPSAC